MAEAISVSLGVDITPAERKIAELSRMIDSKRFNLKLNTGGFQINNLTRDVSNFDRELNRASNRVLAFASAGAVFFTLQRGLTELVRSTVEVDKGLSRIAVNLDLTEASFKRFSAAIFDTARQTGATFEQAAKASEELARQGLPVAETLGRLKDALILARIAGLSELDAVTTLTAALNTFNKEALTSTEVVAKLAAVDTRFAVSSRDLSEAISRVGNSAQEAGVSFDELLAIVTSVQQTTQRGGAVIGNSLKTIFQRIARPEALEQLQQIGVAVKDANNDILPAIQILKNLSDTYETLSGAQKNFVAEQLGGIYQINILRAAVADLGKEYSTYDGALRAAANATDEAIQKNEELNKSLSSLLNQTTLSFKQLATALGNQSVSPFIKGIADGVEGLRKYLSGDTGSELGKTLGDGIINGLTNTLLIGTGAVAFALGKALFKVAKSFGADLQGLLGINNLTQQRTTALERINVLMNQATAAERAQIQNATTLNAQAAAYLALQARVTAQIEKQALAGRALADQLIAGGVLGGGIRSTRRAAGGYVPAAMGAEQSAISAGVGGASPGARPVYLPNVAGGLVANTDEYIVPTPAGDAIYNPNMVSAFGLPKGSKRVGGAAGGYIPHAAGGYSDPSYYQNLTYGVPRPPISQSEFGNVRGAKGQFLPATEIRQLEGLFAAVRRAGDGAQARDLGRAVIDFSQKLGKVSQENILGKLGREFELFDKGIVQAVRAGLSRESARKASPEMMAEFEARRASPNVIGLTATELNMRRAARRAQQEFISEQYATPIGPPAPSATTQQGGFLAGLKRRATSPTGLLASAIGLPLLGGQFESFFSESNKGGTAGGMAVSGISSALTGAGAGAIFGPTGLAIGAAAGGLVGVFGKLRKSTEELAAELDAANTSVKERAQSFGGVIAAQSALNDAASSPNTTAKELEQLTKALANATRSLDKDLIQKVQAAGGNLDKLKEVSQELLDSVFVAERNKGIATAFSGITGSLLRGNRRDATDGAAKALSGALTADTARSLDLRGLLLASQARQVGSAGPGERPGIVTENRAALALVQQQFDIVKGLIPELSKIDGVTAANYREVADAILRGGQNALFAAQEEEKRISVNQKLTGVLQLQAQKIESFNRIGALTGIAQEGASNRLGIGIDAQARIGALGRSTVGGIFGSADLDVAQLEANRDAQIKNLRGTLGQEIRLLENSGGGEEQIEKLQKQLSTAEAELTLRTSEAIKTRRAAAEAEVKISEATRRAGAFRSASLTGDDSISAFGALRRVRGAGTQSDRANRTAAAVGALEQLDEFGAPEDDGENRVKQNLRSEDQKNRILARAAQFLQARLGRSFQTGQGVSADAVRQSLTNIARDRSFDEVSRVAAGRFSSALQENQQGLGDAGNPLKEFQTVTSAIQQEQSSLIKQAEALLVKVSQANKEVAVNLGGTIQITSDLFGSDVAKALQEGLMASVKQLLDARAREKDKPMPPGVSAPPMGRPMLPARQPL